MRSWGDGVDGIMNKGKQEGDGCWVNDEVCICFCVCARVFHSLSHTHVGGKYKYLNTLSIDQSANFKL